MDIDVVTGPEVPSYTGDLVARLGASCDVRVIRSKSYNPAAWAQAYALFDLPRLVRKAVRTGSVLHVDTQRLAYVLASSPLRPAVVTCNDVLTLTDVYADESYEVSNGFVRGLRKQRIRRGLSRAAALVSPSRFTKDELCSLLPHLASRVRVIPWAIDLDRFRPRDRAHARSALSLPADRPIVLAVGTESPRKNIERLVTAFASPIVDRRAILVRIGRPRFPLRDRLLRIARELGVSGRIVFVDAVSPDYLPLYYAAADVFVQPSLHEGFGIPPLEAMACGTPVVASDTGSLPEVLADAARFVDPEDVGAIAEGLREILANPSVADEIRGRGLARAKAFPWASSVEGYLRAFRDVRSADGG